jgi:hypothetical protein
MSALQGNTFARDILRISRALLADMGRYMFRVSTVLPALLPEAEAELPNLDRDAEIVHKVGNIYRIKSM